MSVVVTVTVAVAVAVADGQQTLYCQTLSSGPAGSNTMESLKQTFSALLLSGLSSVVAFLSPFQQPRNSNLGGRCVHCMMKSTDFSQRRKYSHYLIALV